jgi:hypothetical protein
MTAKDLSIASTDAVLSQSDRDIRSALHEIDVNDPW